MKSLSPGRIGISFIAIFTSVSPFVADFNETHVYNPEWPPHARFHNGQTMSLGLICGLLSLYFLWIRKTATALENLKIASLIAALYWLSMAPAILYPGTAFVDRSPGESQGMFAIGGMAVTQLHMDIVIFIILLVSFAFERKNLAHSTRPVQAVS